eukprot:157143_1
MEEDGLKKEPTAFRFESGITCSVDHLVARMARITRKTHQKLSQTEGGLSESEQASLKSDHDKYIEACKDSILESIRDICSSCDIHGQLSGHDRSNVVAEITESNKENKTLQQEVLESKIDQRFEHFKNVENKLRKLQDESDDFKNRVFPDKSSEMENLVAESDTVSRVETEESSPEL